MIQLHLGVEVFICCWTLCVYERFVGYTYHVLRRNADEDFAFFVVFCNFWAFLVAIVADELLAADRYTRAPYAAAGVHDVECQREYCTLLAYAVYVAFEALGGVL